MNKFVFGCLHLNIYVFVFNITLNIEWESLLDYVYVSLLHRISDNIYDSTKQYQTATNIKKKETLEIS